jgi:uncharacterized protein (TIGR00369 family)
MNVPENAGKFIFPPGSFQFLGLEIAELEGGVGYCKLRAQGKAQFCNPGGVMQGGILAAMLDDAMAISATALHEFKKIVPTLDMKVNYLRPVFPEALTIEGEVVKSGRRIAYLAGRLYDAEDKLCVTATATAQLKAIP